MRRKLLQVLRCPACYDELDLFAREPQAVPSGETYSGQLICRANGHTWDIRGGIVYSGLDLNTSAVRQELTYEHSTYHGDPRLIDESIITRFPDTLPQLWPHTRHFGPDFRGLIDRLAFSSDTWTLDIGTAACWTTRLLAQKGGNVIALDINDAMFYGLATAELQFQAHGVYFDRLLESMTRLPLCADSMDHITFNASFHHTPDMCQTLRECYRVLRRQGVVAMVNEEFILNPA